MGDRKWGPEHDTIVREPLSCSPLGDTTAPIDAAAEELDEPDEPGGEIGRRVGRYVILSILGSGAMGLVFAAYDPQLDRKVALKRLRTTALKRRAVAELRLRREAQALARLNHVNVVTIHEVAVYAGQLYIVMEFIAGQTLREWFGRAPDYREIVRMFTAAGEGLRAAHAEGLTHRDFKPDNVMLGDDGRVRVMDFGLARLGEEFVSSDAITPPSEADPVSRIDLRITRTGAWLGTPAYMAPEQFSGQLAGPLSDQFSFCVALYEALYGRRPFPGRTFSELGVAVLRGEMRPPPRGGHVPAWLARAVTRGLASDPQERHASMEALLTELGRDPHRRTRRLGAAAALVAALVGAGRLGASFSTPAKQVEACEGFDTRLAGTWDDARRATVEAALEGTQLSYAADTWTRVEAGLDDYAKRWVGAREAACRATQAGEQSGELLDRRMACLDRQLGQLGETVELLASADETIVREGAKLVRGLPSLTLCSDSATLMAEQLPDDPDLAARVQQLDAELVSAQVAAKVGKIEPSLARVSVVVEEVARIGYEPFETRALLVEARLLMQTQAYTEAEAKFRRSYESAVGLGMGREAAEASIRLMTLLGRDLARYEEAERWEEDARPWTRAVGSDETLGEYLTAVGMIARDRGHYERAQSTLERAVEVVERVYGPMHLEVASTRIALGITHAKVGAYDLAQLEFEHALTIYDSELGPSHPQVASVLNNLSLIASHQEDDASARTYLERALAIYTANDPSNAALGTILTNLGELEVRADQPELAREHLTRALALKQQILGPEHPKLTSSLSGLARAELALGEPVSARAHYERALAIVRAAKGPEHAAVAKVLLNLAKLSRAEGNDTLALAQIAEALGIFERSVGATHDNVALCLIERAEIAVRREDYARARDDYVRAIEILSANLGPESAQVRKLEEQLGQL